MSSVSLLNNLRWGFRRYRRLFAAVVTGAAVLVGFSIPSNSGSESPVLVAAHDLDGGAILAESDLSVSMWPTHLIPAGALTSVSEASGLATLIALSTKTPITRNTLLETGQLVPAGKVALPTTFAESAGLALLKVGATIDIIGPDPETGVSKVLASSVRVVALPQALSESAFSSTTQVVLIEVTPQAAATLNAAGGVSPLRFALH